MEVTFYAAAADAAGTSNRRLSLGSPVTARALRGLLADAPALATVLPQCTLLVDGVAVTDPATVLPPDARVDVLPPFAGG